jgi:hypothetical protein
MLNWLARLWGRLDAYLHDRPAARILTIAQISMAVIVRA